MNFPFIRCFGQINELTTPNLVSCLFAERLHLWIRNDSGFTVKWNYPYNHFGDFLLDVIISLLLLAGILWWNVISTHLFRARPLEEKLGLFWHNGSGTNSLCYLAWVSWILIQETQAKYVLKYMFKYAYWTTWYDRSCRILGTFGF